MAKVTMKGPAGLVPVYEKDVCAYKARGYVVIGEHVPEEKARADCDKIEKPAPASAPKSTPDPSGPEEVDEDIEPADGDDGDE